MIIDPYSVWSDIQAIRNSSPLIHNITNYVVMEQTANALLAIGASPVMAHAKEEVEQMVQLASCLVLNIGTLSSLWIEAMQIALQAANKKKIPIVLDPVGVGATAYRTNTAEKLLQIGAMAAIRGNASEIAALIGKGVQTKGVDSTLDSTQLQWQAQKLAMAYNTIIWMSGKTDVITDGSTTFLIHNGNPLMSKVTGMGCTATAILAAFAAVNPSNLRAAANAAIAMGVAAEVAATHCQGPGSFKAAFIDALHSLSLQQLQQLIHVEIAV